MATSYDDTILKVLTEAGKEGLSVQKIAHHVFNASNTFFETVSLEEVHRYVQQYLLRNSKSEQSLIQRTEKRGYYRLNTQNSADARQLMLNFREEEEETQEKEKPTQDFSLDLFA